MLHGEHLVHRWCISAAAAVAAGKAFTPEIFMHAVSIGALRRRRPLSVTHEYSAWRR